MTTENKPAPVNLLSFIEPTGIRYEYFQGLISGLAAERICSKQLCAIAVREYRSPPEKDNRTGKDRHSIRDCSLDSVLDALLKCAMWGLYPIEGEDHVYLSYYNGKCDAMLGYRGKREIKARVGIRMTGVLVYSNDIFEPEYGTNKSLRHIPAFPERGDLIGAYGYATFADGDFDFHILTKKEMDENNKSAAKTTRTWEESAEAMYRKTAYNMHFNYLPDSLFSGPGAIVPERLPPVMIDQELLASATEETPEVIQKTKMDTADLIVADMEKADAR